METIKSYLENMFLNLPNTAEIQRAKSELLQMMEDKYTELKEEGKTENEAVGIVISEFGNLEELAGDLGISGIMSQDYSVQGKFLSLEEVKKYLSAKAKHAYFIAFGVFLCIISVCGPIVASGLADYNINNEMNDVLESFGVVFMLLVVAVAVGMFVYSGVLMGDWERLEKEPYSTDFATTEYINSSKENYKMTHALLMTMGVICCVLCIVPPVIIDSISHSEVWKDNFSAGFMFIMAGIGVFMLVLTSVKQEGYDKLLKLNKQGTMGGNFVPSQQEQYNIPEIGVIMSVYWHTVTCIYLIWSFLTFDWHVTWIIWPVAAVIHGLIEGIDKSSR